MAGTNITDKRAVLGAFFPNLNSLNHVLILATQSGLRRERKYNAVVYFRTVDISYEFLYCQWKTGGTNESGSLFHPLGLARTV